MAFDPAPHPVRLLLAPASYPGFATRSSYWTRYEALALAGITAMSGTLEIAEIDRFPGILSVNLGFDPAVWPTETYGLAYGDDTLEASIQRAVGRILGVDAAPLAYTEQGMQGRDHVSLEGGRSLIELFFALSAHRLLELMRAPDVLAIAGPFGSFERSTQTTDRE